MPRPKKPPTKTVRLPVEVVDALRRRAEKKGLSVGDFLTDALHLTKETA